MVIAADRRQARVTFAYIDAFFQVPMLQRMVSARLKESVELRTRVKIEIHTASFKATRGYTVIAAIADECAFWSGEDSANPDVEIVNALRPAMSTIPDALLLGISSPYARKGLLWSLYREHFGKDDSDILIWQGDTRSMNPSVPESLIETAYANDQAAASAEYGGLFRSDIESFLSSEIIEHCVLPQRYELPPSSDVSYVAFTDPSGGSSDSFTLAIAHREKEVAVLDAIREVRPPFSPQDVVKQFSDLLATYRVHQVVGDAYAGEWVKEQFAARGVSYKTSELVRSQIYLELLPAVMSGRIELLDNRRLTSQLSNLERRTARSGRDSVDHAPGSHDDVANAAAGALRLALRRHAGRHPLMEYHRLLAIRGEIGYHPALFDSPQEYATLRREHQQASNSTVVENEKTGEKLRWDGHKWVGLYWDWILGPLPGVENFARK